MTDGYDQVDMTPNTPVDQCEQCGALVMARGRDAHNRFHDSLRASLHNHPPPPPVGPGQPNPGPYIFPGQQ
jgi:hypothetical protein